MIPEIDIWRAVTLILKRYGEKALEESATRADELAAQDDHNGQAIWRRITQAVSHMTPPGALHCRQEISFRSRIVPRRPPLHFPNDNLPYR